ncbi:MAG: 2-amino-4-hydroxy-6-hydroxymethyldihydropteridine diphosphokinase [Propionibacteriaceae bacterium]|nr:2-amino-4-hydroxy-6-hydroxymethyldihydropteridine diphosphokinase [Propionibacteriaceae bacterium]
MADAIPRRVVSGAHDEPSGLGRMDLTGVEAWAYHGVFDNERQDGQLFRVDVTWWQDFTQAAQADDLGSTTDYSMVADEVVDLLQGSPVDLIETLAARIQRRLLDRFSMAYVRVRIHKPQAPLSVTFADVIVTTPIASRREVVIDAKDVRPPSRPVVFSLGSNIEPRAPYLQFALDALATTPGLSRVTVSRVYETEPVGVTGQNRFLNAVVRAWSDLSAPALLDRGLQIEALAGRVRSVPHGPRTLDIDLISVGDEVSEDPQVMVPHPRAHERAFVLRPWLDCDPHAILEGRPVQRWLDDVGEVGVVAVDDTLFLP